MESRLRTWVAVVAFSIAGAVHARDSVTASLKVQEPAGTTHALQSVSPWVRKAERIGPAADTQRVLITAYLSWQHPAQLAQLLQELSDPTSARYGQYLTPEEFHAAFSPTAADVALVQRTLTVLGFTIEYTPDSGLFVRASGTVAQVREAFKISQDLYAYRGRTLRAHAEEPTLPPALRSVVTHIAGLDDSAKLMRPMHSTRAQAMARMLGVAAGGAAAGPSSSGIQPPFGFDVDFICSKYWGDSVATLAGDTPFPYGDVLPWLPCGYDPTQVRQAYGANHVSETGKGVRVAITDLYFSPTLVADVNRYSANHGLPPLTQANFQTFLPANVNQIPSGDPCGSSSWLVEQTLDVTAVHAMAPNASILFVGGACDTTDSADGGVALEPLYEVIDHRLADIVSDSWLYNGEADVSPGQQFTDNLRFIQAAIEGMSLLFASGDDGDLTLQGSCFGGPNGIASGSWPSTSPLVTSVGGTSLLLKKPSGEKAEYGWGYWGSPFFNGSISPDGSTVSEQGWFDPFFWICGSGGGPSLAMPEPLYQRQVVPERLATQTVSATGQVVFLSFPARVTPDISALADLAEGFLVGETYLISSPPADGGCIALSSTTEYCEQAVGGTSLATPLLAGMLALVNEARFAHHRFPVGFVNPALYQLPVGQHWHDDAPIIDVNAPRHPTGGLIGLADFSDFAGFAAIDSNLDANGNVIENADTSLLSAPGYDPVTGLGVPNVPALIRALDSSR
jgi:subtilase family serine protease